MNNKKEYILCAAYLLKEEYRRSEEHCTNYKDTRLWDKYDKFDDIYKCELGRRHNDILQRVGRKLVADQEGGFYTSWGRYVTRKEAANIAIDCGQCTPEWGDRLFSEDLY